MSMPGRETDRQGLTSAGGSKPRLPGLPLVRWQSTDAMFPLSLISVSEYCSKRVLASMNSTSGRASPFTSVFFKESETKATRQARRQRAAATASARWPLNHAAERPVHTRSALHPFATHEKFRSWLLLRAVKRAARSRCGETGGWKIRAGDGMQQRAGGAADDGGLQWSVEWMAACRWVRSVCTSNHACVQSMSGVGDDDEADDDGAVQSDLTDDRTHCCCAPVPLRCPPHRHHCAPTSTHPRPSTSTMPASGAAALAPVVRWCCTERAAWAWAWARDRKERRKVLGRPKPTHRKRHICGAS